jgi:NitT/TauT family transport system substrate-binding protein
LDKVTFGTNWIAQAEHGGFYQAISTGIYKDHGLDVTIKMVDRRFLVVLNF